MGEFAAYVASLRGAAGASGWSVEGTGSGAENPLDVFEYRPGEYGLGSVLRVGEAPPGWSGEEWRYWAAVGLARCHFWDADSRLGSGVVGWGVGREWVASSLGGALAGWLPLPSRAAGVSGERP